MEKEKEIIFEFHRDGHRMSADCLDTYNWLLDVDEKVAELWKAKYQGAEKEIKKENNL